MGLPTAGHPPADAVLADQKVKLAPPYPVVEKPPWWRCAALFLFCGVSWVASIPILIFALAGAIRAHTGWIGGAVTGIAMFSVLVQVDQRIAAAVVFLVSFASAAFDPVHQATTLSFAMLATAMTMLNGCPSVCWSSPRLLDFQRRHYPGYFKRSELRGDLHTIKPGHTFFACHPHGILSVGWISNVIWGTRFRDVAGRCIFLIDGTLRNKGLLARLWFDAFEGPHGGFRDTSKSSMQSLMEKGESVAMIPGAYQEATRFVHGRERVALLRRKGFVKYCLQSGYRIHPVYTFGESETYNTVGGFDSFRLWLNEFGIPTVTFWGLPLCPLLPKPNCELLTYVGEPLELPKIEKPTPQDVDEWHAKYVEALRATFNKYRAEAGVPDRELEVL